MRYKKTMNSPNLTNMRPVTSIEELKALELGIMKQVHEFCEEKGLFYFLGCGTLLGAIRHDGFIPWDDDIDIMMPRGDYMQFIRDFPQWGKEHGLFLASPYTKDHYFPFDFTKVCRTGTILNERALKWKYTEGVFIDIFPMDGVPLNKTRRLFHQKTERTMKHLLASSGFDLKSEGFKKDFKYSKPKRALIYILNWIPIEWVLETDWKITGKYDYEKSKYVQSNGCLRIYKKEWVKDRVLHKFETEEFYVPVNYHEVLIEMFDENYMTPPPKHLQVPHHVQDVWIRKDFYDTSSEGL